MPKYEQTELFTRNTIRQINIYHEAPKQESKTEGSQVKLTPTQKEALKSICREQGMGISTFISKAMDTYLEIYPVEDKIRRHKDILFELLSGLP